MQAACSTSSLFKKDHADNLLNEFFLYLLISNIAKQLHVSISHRSMFIKSSHRSMFIKCHFQIISALS